MKRIVAAVLVAVVLAMSAHSFEVMEASIDDIKAAFASGEITCAQLVDLYLNRINAYDQAGPRINAIVSVNPNATQEAAAKDMEADRRKSSQPLWCIPFIAKDNFNFKKMPTTGGSIVLNNTYTVDNAFIIDKLYEAGAILLGKSNMPDFAMLGTNTNSSIIGQTKNTYNLKVTPSASSGGSGSAAAGSFAAFALGTDTQGSIQNPSSVQSLFGLRPTQYLLSLEGVLPLSSHQDTPGPMCRTAKDLAYVMEVIDAGHLLKRPKVPYTSYLKRSGLLGVRIGFLNSTLEKQLGVEADPEVVMIMNDVIEMFRDAGAIVHVIDDRLGKGGAIWGTVNSPQFMPCAYSTQVSDWNNYFGTETTKTSPIKSFDDLLSAMQSNPRNPEDMTKMMSDVKAGAIYEYPRGYEPECLWWQELKMELGRFNEFARMKHMLDLIIFPSMNRPPDMLNPPEGEPGALPFSHLSALTGDPALVMPAGYTESGLPVGVTLLGRRFQEPELVQFAYAFEQFHKIRRPPGTVPPLSR